MQPKTVISHDLPALGITEKVRGTWCYAAAGSAIIQALTGVKVSQEQLVHECYMYIADNDLYDRSRSDWTAIEAYGKKVRQIRESFGVPTTATYDDIEIYLEAGDKDLLKKSYGQLSLERPGLTVSGAKIDFEGVIATINKGGLVACGTAMHWLVIYGYTERPDGMGHDLLVWDPTNGKGKTYEPGDADELLGSPLVYVTYKA